MARTPQSTLTCTMRSSEHAAHRLLMHMCSHIALASCSLSGLSSPVSLFLPPVPLPALPDVHLAPDEISMEDPLCDSSLGSMVTLDYVTPFTFFERFNCSSMWNANGLRVTQESFQMQASPRLDVDEAPYTSNAPGIDLLHVTELEDAHDSIELLNFDDNLRFFYTETLSISDSDETAGQCKSLVCVICFQLSRSPVSSRDSLRSTFFGTRIRITRSAIQSDLLEMDESEALRGF